MTTNIKAFRVPTNIYEEPTVTEVSLEYLLYAYIHTGIIMKGNINDRVIPRLPIHGSIALIRDEESEESKNQNLPFEGAIYGGYFLINCTNVDFFPGKDEAPFTSLTDEQINYLQEYFNNVRSEYDFYIKEVANSVAKTGIENTEYAEEMAEIHSKVDVGIFKDYKEYYSNFPEVFIARIALEKLLERPVKILGHNNDNEETFLYTSNMGDFDALFDTPAKVDHLKFFEEFGLFNVYVVHDGLSDFNPLKPDFLDIEGDYFFVKMIVPYNFSEEDEYHMEYCQWFGDLEIEKIRLFLFQQKFFDIADEFYFDIVKKIVTGDKSVISPFSILLEVDEDDYNPTNELKNTFNINK